MTDTTVTPALIEKLQKILALTNSPVEGEAAAAAEMLQKFLTKHNLEMADLERRGTAAPSVHKDIVDLGKAAFQWKLNLAKTVAGHYYCYAFTDWQKRVHFVGRPDNVEAMKMLYAWLIEQIKQISANARREHQSDTGEHIDPLRWQVNFGLGAVSRLSHRLSELRDRQREDASTTALVIHHETEISDWMEENGYSRPDGRPTKRDLQREAEWAQRRSADIFVREFAHDKWLELHPEETEEGKAAAARRIAQWEAESDAAFARSERSRKAAETRRARHINWDELRSEEQAAVAADSGRRNADKVNLQPFLRGPVGRESQID